ncbi:uncharacterized protein KZ484_018156 isoform 2-T2 [Pholidichthys leucotaenia]
MQIERNRRGFPVHFKEGKHLKLADLRKEIQRKVVGKEEVQSAETRLLEKEFPDRTEQQAAVQENFLSKFATSPAFSEKSRLGPYRFTFPLEEVLKAYSQQFCGRKQPVMRIYRTDLYKQEVMYAVLVHSPADNKRFSSFPLLSDDPDAVCVYKDGHFIWRAEAMCETHRFKLIHKPEVNQMETREVRPQFYVWDHIGMALHMKKNQVLQFNKNQLRENVTLCEQDNVTINKGPYEKFDEALNGVVQLWFGSKIPLEKERCSSTPQHYPSNRRKAESSRPSHSRRCTPYEKKMGDPASNVPRTQKVPQGGQPGSRSHQRAHTPVVRKDGNRHGW